MDDYNETETLKQMGGSMRLAISAKRANPKAEDPTTTRAKLKKEKEKRLADYTRREEERRAADAVSKTLN